MYGRVVEEHLIDAGRPFHHGAHGDHRESLLSPWCIKYPAEGPSAVQSVLTLPVRIPRKLLCNQRPHNDRITRQTDWAACDRVTLPIPSAKYQCIAGSAC